MNLWLAAGSKTRISGFYLSLKPWSCWTERCMTFDLLGCSTPWWGSEASFPWWCDRLESTSGRCPRWTASDCDIWREQQQLRWSLQADCMESSVCLSLCRDTYIVYMQTSRHVFLSASCPMSCYLCTENLHMRQFAYNSVTTAPKALDGTLFADVAFGLVLGGFCSSHSMEDRKPNHRLRLEAHPLQEVRHLNGGFAWGLRRKGGR